ncbi:Hypothetical protein mma_0809 [Janthinobacterium sp. Marseille]|nr:antitoxin Xre/MbcA/ParS toxin-binding domain-containing protein [Janthinobacterium sp. Marseille]ABR91843.1 Hypothetical protein mma_0809 [Janthinobacterium sp. Marseille]
MSVQSLKTKRGRPPKDMANRIRTLAWFRAVQKRSGKSSVELGREFHPKDYSYDGEKQKTSHRWERYAAGTHSPVDDTEISLIDIVEGKYPGTAYWFRHLIWTAMGQAITNTNEINIMLASLDASVVDICFVPQAARDKATLTRAPYDYGVPTKLSYLRSLDGLTAILLLVREAELVGNGRAHAQLMFRISETLFFLKKIPELFEVLEDVVECLNEKIARFKYHMVGDITLPGPQINLARLMEDEARFWEIDEYRALEHQLIEKLQRLFNDTSMLISWLDKPHPILGEAPRDALLHPQGVSAVRSLLEF